MLNKSTFVFSARLFSMLLKSSEGLILQLGTKMEQQQSHLKDLRTQVKNEERSLFSRDEEQLREKELRGTIAISIRNISQQASHGFSNIFHREKKDKIGSSHPTTSASADRTTATSEGESDLHSKLKDIQTKMEDLQCLSSLNSLIDLTCLQTSSTTVVLNFKIYQRSDKLEAPPSIICPTVRLLQHQSRSILELLSLFLLCENKMSEMINEASVVRSIYSTPEGCQRARSYRALLPLCGSFYGDARYG